MKVFFTEKNLLIKNNLGNALKMARLRKNISLSKISRILNIKEQYLIALEEENFNDLPINLYAKNYLKDYAKFLDLDANKLVQKSPFNAIEKEKNPFSQRIMSTFRLLVFPKIIRNIIISVLIVSLFSYLAYYLLKSKEMPQLLIFQPERDLITQEREIKVEGKSTIGAEIRINGELVLADENAYFNETIYLKQGVNEIEISAKKKYSQKNIIERKIIVQ
jgi:transcriptional regulator with XRE-family HTH domain